MTYNVKVLIKYHMIVKYTRLDIALQLKNNFLSFKLIVFKCCAFYSIYICIYTSYVVYKGRIFYYNHVFHLCLPKLKYHIISSSVNNSWKIHLASYRWQSKCLVTYVMIFSTMAHVSRLNAFLYTICRIWLLIIFLWLTKHIATLRSLADLKVLQGEGRTLLRKQKKRHLLLFYF